MTDSCQGVFCRAGRVCQPLTMTSSQHRSSARRGKCVCASADYCASSTMTQGQRQGHHGHRRQQQQENAVCGSDGRWYPSHCELHRVACVTKVHLSTDRTGAGCPPPSAFDPAITDPASGSLHYLLASTRPDNSFLNAQSLA